MKLLFAVSLLYQVRAFEVLNCALDPRNVKTWDLTEVGSCEIPEDQFKNGTNIKVQIVVTWKRNMLQFILVNCIEL